MTKPKPDSAVAILRQQKQLEAMADATIAAIQLILALKRLEKAGPAVDEHGNKVSIETASQWFVKAAIRYYGARHDTPDP